jgi:hypothetical protein
VADSLRVDPADLRAAASHAGAAASGAAPGSAQVAPCAPDVVSVATSTSFGELVDVTRRYTAMANDEARHLGVLLDASGTAYETQEGASAGLLGGAGLSAPAPAGMAAPPAMPPTAGLLGGQGVTAPAGEVPAAPRDIARLIEHGRGGPGPQAWQAAERSLRSDAGRLDDAADQLGAAISTAEDSWVSGSADIATGRMRALQTWYRGHATYVRGLADYADGHVQNFRKATTDIPTYKAVLDGERELQQAQEANQRSRGAFKPAVVHAQVKLGQLYQASTTGYSSYTVAEAMQPPPMPAPPPRPPAETPDVIKAKGPGNGPVGPRPHEPTPSSAPLDPVQHGSGVGESLTSSGPTWPPGAVDPPNPAVNKDTAQLFSGVLKDVTTAASGFAGPLASAMAGTVGSLTSGFAGAAGAGVSAASQAASAASKATPANAGGGSPEHGGEPSSPGSEPPSSSGGDPAGKDPAQLADSGIAPGDTEPAMGGGGAPLSAPIDTASTPAIAAPAAAPLAAAPAETSAPAAGGMGPMMAPPMGAPRGGSGGDGQRDKLYQERQLKVVAPPNSEPVKNRREGRDRARGTDRNAP